MGVGPSKTGITLKFLDEEGNLDKSMKRPVVFGVAAALYSAKRPVEPAAGEDAALYGSTEWLTHVLVAENCEELKKLVPGDAAKQTSMASKKVRVQARVAQSSGGFESIDLHDRITIAIGHQTDSPYFTVEEILVLPPTAKLQAGHVLWKAWSDGPNTVERKFEGAGSNIPLPPHINCP